MRCEVDDVVGMVEDVWSLVGQAASEEAEV